MKKRLSLLIALVMLMTTVLTACGPNTIAYLEKTKEVNNWEATESTIEFDYTVKANDPEMGEVEVTIPGLMKAYILGQDKGVIDYEFDFSSIKEMAKESNDEELADFPEKLQFKMYVNENTVIFDKEFFNLASPEENPFKDIENQYIGISVAEFTNTEDNFVKEYEEIGEKVLNLFKTVYDKYESDIDFKRDGDKFTFEFDVADGKDEIINFVEFTQKHIDKLVVGIEPLMIKIAEDEEIGKETTQELKKTIMELSREDLEKGYEEVENTLKGSKIKTSEEFGKDEVKVDVNMVMNIADVMYLDMNLKGTNKKAEVREIKFPTDVKEMTMEEYFLTIANMDGYEFVELEEGQIPVTVFVNDEFLLSDTPTFIEDGRTLAPVRAILEALDAEVEWDEETQTVTATKDDKVVKLTIGEKVADVNGEKVELDKAAMLFADRTYVPVRFFAETFNFKVEFEEEDGFFFVYICCEDEAEKETEEVKTEEKVEGVVEEVAEETEEVKDTEETIVETDEAIDTEETVVETEAKENN